MRISKKLFLIPCFLISVLAISCKKHYDKSLLLGSWTEVEIARGDGKPSKPAKINVFTEYSFISWNETSPIYIADYQLKGNVILMDKASHYGIVKLTSDSLVLQSFDPYINSDPRMEFRIYFARKK